MEVLCCAPVLPSALPSDCYVREGGEWALAATLPGLGSGMVRGPYPGPATWAGFAPARNLNEWPLALPAAGPGPGRWAHGAGRPHGRAAHRPTP